jgi:hypothetical protein
MVLQQALHLQGLMLDYGGVRSACSFAVKVRHLNVLLQCFCLSRVGQ